MLARMRVKGPLRNSLPGKEFAPARENLTAIYSLLNRPA
jgi:hypothetical protein